MPMSDRDCIAAVFSAVLAVGERLTGERLTIHLRREDGGIEHISGTSATWTPIPQPDRPAVSERLGGLA